MPPTRVPWWTHVLSLDAARILADRFGKREDLCRRRHRSLAQSIEAVQLKSSLLRGRIDEKSGNY